MMKTTLSLKLTLKGLLLSGLNSTILVKIMLTPIWEIEYHDQTLTKVSAA
jgi:hypothetical protein